MTKQIKCITCLSNDSQQNELMYVVYDDFSVHRFDDMRQNDLILDRFMEQENKDMETLVSEGLIVFKEYSRERYRKLQSLAYTSNMYSEFKHSLLFSISIFSGTHLASHLSSRIFINNYFTDNMISNCMLGFVSFSALNLLSSLRQITNFEKKYDNSKFNKWLYMKVMVLVLTLSNFVHVINDDVDLSKNLSYVQEMTPTENDYGVNPFDSVKIIGVDINPLSYIDDVEFLTKVLLEAFDVNPELDEKNVKIAQSLHSYLAENPYLDYQKLYDTFATVDIYHYNVDNGDVAAAYFREPNSIVFYDKHLTNSIDDFYVDNLIHELIHSTGYINNKALNEGMTTLLASEYFDSGYVMNNYRDYTLITKIFCELFGSDTMLEAYSKNDISILKDSILGLNSDEQACENLLSFIDYLDNEMTIQDIERFNAVIKPYIMQDLDLDLECVSLYISLLGNNYGSSTDRAYFSKNYKDSLENASKTLKLR